MELAIAVARFVSGAALSGIAGACLLETLHRTAKAPRIGSTALSVIGLLSLVFQLCAAAYNASPDDGWLASTPLQIMALQTWSGKIVLGRMVLVMPLAVALWLQRTRTALALGLLNLLLLPWSGHAAAAPWPWLALLFFGLHTAAALLWAGGVGLLAMRAFTQPADVREPLLRFSPLALRLIGLAVISGAGAAFVQIDGISMLVTSPYGRMLLAKVFILLPLALICAAWLRRYLQRGQGDPRAALAIEALAGLALLAVASLMSQTSPSGEPQTSTLPGLIAT